MRVTAAVLGLVVLAAGCTSASTGQGSAPPGVKVTCRASGSADIPASDIENVRRVLTVRAKKAAVATASVTASVSGRSVTLSIAGGQPGQVRNLCESGSLEYRPLVAPTQPTRAGGGSGTLSGLGFPVPSSDTEYLRRASAQQLRLDAALAAAHCPIPASTDAPVVACGRLDSTSAAISAALLGPAVVTGDQIESANAVAPSANGASWSIQISLDANAREAWAKYTTDHYTTEQALPTGCGSAVPCSDFVGFVLDGTLLSLPLTTSPIDGPTQVTGGFTRSSARQLAAALESGQLPVRLTLVSVTRTR